MAKFNDMPSELRNVLYRELLQNKRSRQPRQHPENELALFTVTKQLHNESTSYFYQNNDIAINAPSTATNTATILPPISDIYLKFLRHLTLHTLTGQAEMPSVRKVASTIGSLAKIGAQFDELDISISSPLSHLLNSRVDDSVMDMDHPITIALWQLLESKVARVTCVELRNAWFAPGVAHTLLAKSGSRLRFFISDTHITNLSLLERPLTGRFSSTHLTTLGLNDEFIVPLSEDDATSARSTPSSLPSSLCSAFANLDTFSVSSFELGSDCEAEKNSGSFDEPDSSEQPFFTEDDIEEWQASTQDSEPAYPEESDDLQDLDGEFDQEMEDVSQEDTQAFMTNLEEIAHHVANVEDVTYMTNFAPDLLLIQHHLSHLA